MCAGFLANIGGLLYREPILGETMHPRKLQAANLSIPAFNIADVRARLVTPQLKIPENNSSPHCKIQVLCDKPQNHIRIPRMLVKQFLNL